jgi:CPA1 family monovalent cation:H+ antiporter
MAADMEGISFAPIGVLLLVACLIAMLTRRLGLPYIVGLLAAGFLISLLPNSPNLPLSRQLIFNVLLPPLVFEAALQLDWRRFRHATKRGWTRVDSYTTTGLGAFQN